VLYVPFCGSPCLCLFAAFFCVAVAFPFAQRLDAGLEFSAIGVEVVGAVVAIGRQTGTLIGDPEIVARGFVIAEDEAEGLFRDAAAVIAECIEASGVEERADQGLMTEKLRVELRRFFKKRSGRRPLVLPVLMEI